MHLLSLNRRNPTIFQLRATPILAATASCILLSAPSARGLPQEPIPPPTSSSLVDSALTALASDQLDLARRAAEEALDLAPGDPDALIALGRVHLAWPRIGRFEALELFRRAARRSPSDPEPHYWIGRVGLALLGDDGEAVARRGLERALALDPLYSDAWELWWQLYRGPDERARMVRTLERHDDHLTVRARIAQLLVESSRCREADSLLARLESEMADPRWAAWRAECTFIERRDREGMTHYDRAVALAGRDTSDALWAQILSIARPDERFAYASLAPQARPEFYRAFWGPRDPNVRTEVNERIAEHFRRRAEARERFRLQHPLSYFHHSEDYRDFVSRTSKEERASYAVAQAERGSRIAEELTRVPSPTIGEPFQAAAWSASLREIATELGQLDEIRPVDLAALSPDILPLGRNLPDMVDDRGLTFIRHGPPDRYEPRRDLDVEEWVYESSPGLHLRFDRGWYPPNPPLPEMLHRPLTGPQARSVAIAMTTSRSSLPAPLQFGFWFARFKNREDPRLTDLLIFPEAGLEATGVLWDGAGRELDRAVAPQRQWVELSSPPGRPALALDVERNDSLGRYRGVVELLDYRLQSPSLSDLLIAEPANPVGLSRENAARGALRSLSLPHDSGFLVYLEIYGLDTGEGDTHGFRVTYTFERERGWLEGLFGGEETISLEYERVVEAGGDDSVVETVRVGPGQVSPGRYTLSVHVRDLVSARTSTSRSVTLDLRP